MKSPSPSATPTWDQVYKKHQEEISKIKKLKENEDKFLESSTEEEKNKYYKYRFENPDFSPSKYLEKKSK